MRQNPLRTLFAQKKLALNGWASIGNSFLAEVVADCGYDAVTVDLQHGLFSIESAVPMLLSARQELSAVQPRHRLLPQLVVVTAYDCGAFDELQAAFATVPPLQMRVLEKATGAPNLASSVNIAAFNLGNALGAWLGGVTIDHGPGLHAVSLVAAMITAGGLVVALISWKLDRKAASSR